MEGGDRCRVPVSSGSVGSQCQVTVTELTESLTVAEVLTPADPVVAGGLPVSLPTTTVALAARRGTLHARFVAVSPEQRIPLRETKVTVGAPLAGAGRLIVTNVAGEVVVPVLVAETVDE
jgi:hypothetical protein